MSSRASTSIKSSSTGTTALGAAAPTAAAPATVASAADPAAPPGARPAPEALLAHEVHAPAPPGAGCLGGAACTSCPSPAFPRAAIPEVRAPAAFPPACPNAPAPAWLLPEELALPAAAAPAAPAAATANVPAASPSAPTLAAATTNALATAATTNVLAIAATTNELATALSELLLPPEVQLASEARPSPEVLAAAPPCAGCPREAACLCCAPPAFPRAATSEVLAPATTNVVRFPWLRPSALGQAPVLDWYVPVNDAGFVPHDKPESFDHQLWLILDPLVTIGRDSSSGFTCNCCHLVFLTGQDPAALICHLRTCPLNILLPGVRDRIDLAFNRFCWLHCWMFFIGPKWNRLAEQAPPPLVSTQAATAPAKKAVRKRPASQPSTAERADRKPRLLAPAVWTWVSQNKSPEHQLQIGKWVKDDFGELIDPLVVIALGEDGSLYCTCDCCGVWRKKANLGVGYVLGHLKDDCKRTKVPPEQHEEVRARTALAAEAGRQRRFTLPSTGQPSTPAASPSALVSAAGTNVPASGTSSTPSVLASLPQVAPDFLPQALTPPPPPPRPPGASPPVLPAVTKGPFHDSFIVSWARYSSKFAQLMDPLVTFERQPYDNLGCTCNFCGRRIRAEPSGVLGHLGICKLHRVLTKDQDQVRAKIQLAKEEYLRLMSARAQSAAQPSTPASALDLVAPTTVVAQAASTATTRVLASSLQAAAPPLAQGQALLPDSFTLFSGARSAPQDKPKSFEHLQVWLAVEPLVTIGGENNPGGFTCNCCYKVFAAWPDPWRVFGHLRICPLDKVDDRMHLVVCAKIDSAVEKYYWLDCGYVDPNWNKQSALAEMQAAALAGQPSSPASAPDLATPPEWTSSNKDHHHRKKIHGWSKRGNPLGRLIDSLVNLSLGAKGSIRCECLCCGDTSAGHLNDFVRHLNKCKLTRLPIEDQPHVSEKIELAGKAYVLWGRKKAVVKKVRKQRAVKKVRKLPGMTPASTDAVEELRKFFELANLPVGKLQQPEWAVFFDLYAEIASDATNLDVLDPTLAQLKDAMLEFASMCTKIATKMLFEEPERGFTVLADGWSDCIGVLLSSFTKALMVATSPNQASPKSEYYLKELETQLSRFGVELKSMHFVCFDGAPTMVKLFDLLHQKYQIQGSVCACHTLSLAMRKLAEVFDRRFGLLSGVEALIDYFRQDGVAKTLAGVMRDCGLTPLVAIKMSDTRFASNFMVFTRLLTLKPHFLRMMGDLKEGQDEDIARIVGDKQFWNGLAHYVTLTSNCYQLMRLFDSASPLAGFTLWSFEALTTQLEERVEALGLQDTTFGRDCVSAFWKTFSKRVFEIDLLSFVTNPSLSRWWRPISGANEDACKQALTMLVKKVRMVNSQPYDGEKEEIAKEIADEVDCILAQLKGLHDYFKNEEHSTLARTMHPVLWFEDVGKDLFPTLSSYAILVLSRAVVTSDLERSFSTLTWMQRALPIKGDFENCSRMATARRFCKSSTKRDNCAAKFFASLMQTEARFWAPQPDVDLVKAVVKMDRLEGEEITLHDLSFCPSTSTYERPKKAPETLAEFFRKFMETFMGGTKPRVAILAALFVMAGIPAESFENNAWAEYLQDFGKTVLKMTQADFACLTRRRVEGATKRKAAEREAETNKRLRVVESS